MPNSVLVYNIGDVVSVDDSSNLYKIMAYDKEASDMFGSPHYVVVRLGSKGKCVDTYPAGLFTKISVR